MTKRRVERLLEEAKENGDHADDDPAEVVVEVGGVPADPPDADDEAADTDRDLNRTDAATFEEFRVFLDPEGEVNTPDLPDPDDLDPDDLAGMPARDLPPELRENANADEDDGEGGTEDRGEGDYA